MATLKVAITIEESLLRQLDQLVTEKIYPSRSRAIQEAVQEKLDAFNKRRLIRELAKLDPIAEAAMADEGLAEDFATWPAY
ncbi:MAG TPA: CopG family transcriptional regulator [Anaerolineae bacterium]|nr:CopG family transcriptional regulator [Anaerolineae bacterium]